MKTDLRGYTDVAKARNQDPEKSHAAAEILNQDGNLKRQQVSVLSLANKHSGKTAKQIGIDEAFNVTSVPKETIERILKIVTPCHKRMPELVRKKLVERADDGRIFINDRGYNYLRNQ